MDTLPGVLLGNARKAVQAKAFHQGVWRAQEKFVSAKGPWQRLLK